MSHVRALIRQRLKLVLSGSPDAGSRVQVRRALPLAKDLDPTLLISIEHERSTDDSMAGGQERIIRFRVAAVAKGDAEATEDTLDRLAVFVERQMALQPPLGGLARSCEYMATEFQFSGEAERTLCVAAMTFEAVVYTGRDNPETAL